MSEKRQHSDSSNYRVTTKDGYADYTKSGEKISDVKNNRDGSSTSHEVGHGIFGPFRGGKKK